MLWPTLTDYQEAIQNPKFCFADEELRAGSPELDAIGLPKPNSGAFATVYQINCAGRKWAVKCFLRYVPDQEQRYAAISEYLLKQKLPCTAWFEFQPRGIRIRGQGYPILKMEWIGGVPLNRYIEQNLKTPVALRQLAGKFLDMTRALRERSIAHGDLQHGNILIVDGEPRLVDYDGMYVPGLRGLGSHEVGHRNYQHPCRIERDFGSHVDNFSAWVIYLSLAALSYDPSLWKYFGEEGEQLLFRREDFERPESSRVFLELEQARVDEVRALAHTFLSFMSASSLSQIPPLGVGAWPQLPETPADGEEAASAFQGQGAAWVWDHMPLPARQLAGSFALERLVLAAVATLIAALGAVFVSAAAPLVSVFLALAVGCGLGGLTLVVRFRHLPEVAAKAKLIGQARALQAQSRQLERAIRQLRKQREHLLHEKEAEARQIIARQQKCAENERRELDGIDQDLQAVQAGLKARHENAEQELQRTLARALRELQRRYLADKLSHHVLDGVSVAGLGPALTHRLVAAGLQTAADVEDVKIVPAWENGARQAVYVHARGRGPIHIPGLGPKKALALLAWRRTLESGYRVSLPQQLPPHTEAELRAGHQIRLQALAEEGAKAEREANYRKGQIRAKYEPQQQALAVELQRAWNDLDRTRERLDRAINTERHRLAEQHWRLAKAKRELEAYRRVNFGSYLRAILNPTSPVSS